MENSGASSLCPSPVCLKVDSHRTQERAEPQGDGGVGPESQHGEEQPGGQEHLPELLMSEQQTSTEFEPSYSFATGILQPHLP